MLIDHFHCFLSSDQCLDKAGKWQIASSSVLMMIIGASGSWGLEKDSRESSIAPAEVTNVIGCQIVTCQVSENSDGCDVWSGNCTRGEQSNSGQWMTGVTVKHLRTIAYCSRTIGNSQQAWILSLHWH